MADIAIFRINYKSDFILTLNSDAGWMTPFCIKFWTGAPSQAYFVGYDGTTYTHCAPVTGEPTKLLVQFDDHHLPIGDLKFQIGYHFTVDDFPTSVEDEVLNQASVIIEVDDAPAQVMLDFNGETAPEIEFSLPAYANEAQRIANEEARIAAEQQRIANEESRIAAETIRQQNEQQRIDHETARVNEFATLKSQSQAATRDANDAATLANQKAQLAADKAALADDAAVLAIQKAQLAADKAALANDAAQLANEKAALAQQKAEYAQQQGGYAKDQGDYAKEQGNYAKAKGIIAEEDHQRADADHGIAVDDHTQAGNDHTRAESDHGIAADDHTQAGNDHTRAESDHGIAADDHTQAGNDHTRAESDHSIAADDHTQAGNDHTRAESDHTRAESDHAAVEVYVDSLGVFDLSKHNAVGGVLATYANLDAALTALNALESKYKYGGMSFKFVQSSDNKYVQFRCMAQNFTTDVTQCQGVDDEPTAGSRNLVTSGGVSDALNNVSIDVDDVTAVAENAYLTFSSTTVGQPTTVTKNVSSGNPKLCALDIKKGDLISFCIQDNQSRDKYAIIDNDGILRYYGDNKQMFAQNKITSEWNGKIYVQGASVNLKKFGLTSTKLAGKSVVDLLYEQNVGINFYQMIGGDLNRAIVNNTALTAMLPDSPIKGVNKLTGSKSNLYIYVKEGLQIKLSNCKDNAALRAYCFTDENLVPISGGYSPGNTSTINTTLTTPSGAKVLFLNLNQATASVEVLREKSADIIAIEAELADHEERIEDIEETLVRNIYSYNNTVSAAGSTNITCYLSAGVTYLLEVSADVANFTLGVRNVGENLGTITAGEVHQITPQNDISNIYFEKYGNVLIKIYVTQTLDERFEKIESYISLKSKYPTFAVLGDSYSTFAGYLEPSSNATYYPADNVTSVDDTWWGMLCKEEGMLLMQNNSYSGTYVCNAESAGALVANSFVNRMQNLPKASVIFVFGGTNDSWNNVDLGEYKYSGWTENDLKQFRPAYAYMLDYLIKHHLGARIICLKNPYAANGTGFTQDIEASVDAICEHYGIETCVNSVISKASNWHPNKIGMTQIKTAIVKLLNQ